MSRLPNITAKEAVSAFIQAGFKVTGQRGSHVHLSDSTDQQLIIPLHGRDLKRPLLKALIKKAGLSEDEFRKFL